MIYKNELRINSEPLPKRHKSHLDFDLPDLRHHKRIFKEILDEIIVQIEVRFADLQKLNFFDLLTFEKFRSYFPQNLINDLLVQYPFFDSIQLKNEITVLYTDPYMFPELYKLISIVTRPVTCAPLREICSPEKNSKLQSQYYESEPTNYEIFYENVINYLFRDYKK